MGRTAKGVKAISLREKDELVGFDIGRRCFRIIERSEFVEFEPRVWKTFALQRKYSFDERHEYRQLEV
jgi:hypothetical protein